MAGNVSKNDAVCARLLREHRADGHGAEDELDNIALLAARLCDAPMAALSILHGNREHFIACHNVSLEDIPLDGAIAAEILAREGALVIDGLDSDPRFSDSPIMGAIPGLRFYAGVPLRMEGRIIGVLAVLDRSGRRLSKEKLEALEILATNTAARLTNIGDVTPSAGSGAVDFQRIFNAIPDLYWVIEPEENRVVAASDAFLRAAMTDRKAMVGKRVFDAFPSNPEDPTSAESIQSLQTSLERVKQLGSADELTLQRYPIPRPEVDGGGFEERYWSAVNVPVFDDDGRLQYIAHRTQDVTELIRLKQSEGDARKGRRQLETRAEKMEADILFRTQELKRLNDHLRLAQHVANIGSWEYNVKDQTRTWSDEVFRILGINRDAMPQGQESIAEIVHPDDRELLADARRRAVNGELTEFEHRIVRPDGEVRHVRERAQVITNAQGEPVRLFGTVEDVTERRRTEARLRQNEELLRIAGQMAKLGAWQWDVSERRVIWSEQVREIHEAPSLSSVDFEEAARFIAPEWRERVNKALEACIQDGTPYDEEFEIISARGNRVWVRAMGKAVRDMNGNVECVQGALQDISQQKRAEARMDQLVGRLTNTLNSMSDGFVTLDNEWRVTFMNRQAEQILGRPYEDLLGKVIWDEFTESVGTEFERQYRRAKTENRTLSFQEYYAPLGIWVEVTAYPSPEGLAIYFRDVTERKRAEAAAQESVARTTLIIENALDAAISISSDSVITDWNRQAEATFGWSREEALGRYLYELVIPERYRDAHRRGLAHFLETGEGPLLNRRVDATALRRNGEEFPVELSISPIRSGSNFTFSAFIRDITDRKEAEKALRESEERFRVVAKATADTVWDWNLVTDAVWWNDGIQAVFGYRPDEIESDSTSWSSRIHPDDAQRVINEILGVIDSDDDEWTAEYRFRCRDGSYAYVIDRGFVIRDHAGKATRMVGGMNDISERREYELKISEQAALLDKAQDAIIVRDINNRITYWNKGAERLYGWTESDAIGRDMEELLRPNPERFHNAIRQVFENGEWTGEIAKRHRNGDVINVEGGWTLVRNESGKPESILTIDTNITDRLALEEQLRQSQRLESIGQLTGGVAHDFNNLLTVILGNAELMVDQLPADNRLRKLAEMSRTAAQRGSELTHRLLAFARRQTLAPEVIDVNELVLGMENLLRRTLPENIDIEIIPLGDAWPAVADPAQLESVLLNLTINAKDAMSDGGLLTIETANVQLDEEYAASHAEVAPGSYVMIAVSDTGAGIPEENIDRVFDPFYTTKEKGKGTGLGLSMAYGFAKQSEGHIKIYSEPDQGTTVKLYLPRSKHRMETVDARPVAESKLAGSERVLVVEDDDLVREYAQNQLTEFGYDVVAARNGPDALEIIKRETGIDLLFTDVIMSGGMNGRELAEAARRLRPGLKVLYTSGYTENAIVHHGRLDRGVQLLQKPYQRVDLASKVRDVLDNSSPGDHPG